MAAASSESTAKKSSATAKPGAQGAGGPGALAKTGAGGKQTAAGNSAAAEKTAKGSKTKADGSKKPVVKYKGMVTGKPSDRAPKEEAPSIVLQPHQVILRPLVTEKGIHRSTRQNAYAFEVHSSTNKTEVGKAVEFLFNVKVEKVNIQNRKGKLRRTKMRTAYTKPWKKAIVFLHKDHRIDFY